MARKYLDTTGLTALWAKIVAKINAIGDSFVQKAGDTMTGSLTMAGKDFRLGTPSSSSNDSSDIEWLYGNGNEKARIWMDNDLNATNCRFNIRAYSSSGTQLFSGKIPLLTDVTDRVAKAGDTMSGSLKFSNTSRNIEIPARSISYVDGAKGNAGLYMPHTYNKDEWGPIMCVQTKTGGSWQIGNYNNDHLSFVKFTKANIDSSKNTMQCQIDLAETGAVETGNGSFIAKDTENPASPSSGSLYGKGFYLRDAANDDYAYLRHHYSGAEKGLQLEVRRSVKGSYVYNTLNMRINASGGRIIQVSDGGAWRSAIGAQAALSTYEQSYTRNHASVSYTEHLRCWRYGNVVTLGGYFSCSGNIAANTLLYTLPAPKFVIYFTAKHETANRMYNFNLQTNGQLKTNEAIAGGNYLVCFTYVCA